jgi:hypothetical protein
VVDPCEHSREPSGFIPGGECRHWRRDYRLLKEAFSREFSACATRLVRKRIGVSNIDLRYHYNERNMD